MQFSNTLLDTLQEHNPFSRAQVHLEWARHDLAKLSDDISIPSWVDGVIYGTVVIVSGAL